MNASQLRARADYLRRMSDEGGDDQLRAALRELADEFAEEAARVEAAAARVGEAGSTRVAPDTEPGGGRPKPEACPG